MEYVTDEEIQQRKAEPVKGLTPYYSIILLVCIGVLFFIQAATGLEHSVEAAAFNPEKFRGGEYWRIMTSGALHGNVMHILFNGYALYVLGRLIELLSNRAHLAIVFVLSIIGGGLMSLALGPGGNSLGASGGIIGFLGYLTVYGYKRRKIISDAFLKNMLFNIGLIAFFGVFVIPNVDNFAHLGGLLVGAAYGFVQVPSDLYADPREVSKTTNYVGIGAMVFYILTAALAAALLFRVI